ncbi:hypothetical protein Lfu02_70950 [Longispora fulva]|uniref:DUF4386 family protein n=1 Tax=Longispora fulva TaxID=619741 RepID=A0A8J7GNU6_9ACTN|nr:hypothetical protein [Longispora fulva]MBG6141280.1 hypothetical protein [Longispora fulva]GIG62723.1 hypothetical protein Lfu02_70950 [Longispora fulva]
MFTRLARLAPLTGVVFLLLLVACFIVGGNGVDSDKPTDKVVAYWKDNDTRQIWACLLALLATLALVWFAGSLRQAVSRAEGGDGRLAQIAFGGALLAAVGLLTFSGFAYLAADTVGKVPGEITHTFTVIANDLFFPLTAGLALLLGASGLAFLYTALLPRWLGWVSIAMAVAVLTPWGFWVVLLAALWIAGVGIVLFMRGGAPA